ncbi:hypothetical protein ACOMHN_002923 [Nucella lapillus]
MAARLTREAIRAAQGPVRVVRLATGHGGAALWANNARGSAVRKSQASDNKIDQPRDRNTSPASPSITQAGDKRDDHRATTRKRELTCMHEHRRPPAYLTVST